MGFGVERELDGFAKATGCGDQFVASDEGWDADACGDGARFTVHDFQQEPSGSLTGLEEIHVRIGVVGDDGVAQFEHAPCGDAMEVEGDDEGDVWTEDAPCFGEEVAFGVEFGLACHGAVHAEVDGIGWGRVPDRVEELRGDAGPSVCGEGSP